MNKNFIIALVVIAVAVAGAWYLKNANQAQTGSEPATAEVTTEQPAAEQAEQAAPAPSESEAAPAAGQPAEEAAPATEETQQ